MYIHSLVYGSFTVNAIKNNSIQCYHGPVVEHLLMSESSSSSSYSFDICNQTENLVKQAEMSEMSYDNEIT